ncbi:isoleucine--tRNA ligase, partial [Candidatus Poribacteria bacterium]
SIDPEAPESVHLCDYPVPDRSLIDERLEWEMEVVRGFVELGRAARNRVKIKIRQPLSEIVIGTGSEAEREAVRKLEELILEELNIKRVVFDDDLTRYASVSVKPNFRLLGPKYGARVQSIARALSAADPVGIKRQLDSEGAVEIELEDGERVKLERNEIDMRFESLEGWSVEVEGNRFVALNTEITEELMLEGLARELVNKIQQMRKEADFNVADRIELYLSSTETVHKAFEVHREYIMGETLSVRVVDRPSEGMFVKKWKVNGHPAEIGVKQVKR